MENIFTLDPSKLEKCDGIWISFGVNYDEFCNDFLNLISDESHEANGCVKFYVGIKKQ